MNTLSRNACIAIAVGTLAIGCNGWAADTPPTPSTRIPTVTRLVKLFEERENALAAAMRAGDAGTLDRILGDDFELRTGARAAPPMPRAEFIADAVRNHPAGGTIRRMAVHDVNGTAIVSFVQENAQAPAIYLVDVWRSAGNDWKLLIRYAAPAGTPDFPIPGAGTITGDLPKKY